MGQTEFSSRVNEFVATLVELFRHQSRRDIVDVLENAHAHFDETGYDNWNGGTYTWALRLEVPVHIFALVEPKLASVEKEVGDKLGHFIREYPNDQLGEVTITPLAFGATPTGQRMAPPEREVRRLWSEGRFRLFLSHLSIHRVLAAQLKEALRLRGIHAFVAHEDIEPSLKWQDEIELALRSMHALAALLTPEFHVSKWTDQEVGWALGRGVLVIPLRLGLDPYGLMGKFQGVPGKVELPKRLAARTAKILLTNNQTHSEMRRSVISSFQNADSIEMAIALSDLLCVFPDIADDERKAVWGALAMNQHVSAAEGVSDKVVATFGAPPTKRKSDENDVPF
jgi:hypothetical protein